MTRLLSQITNSCVYLWEVTQQNTPPMKSNIYLGNAPEIHLPPDMFDKLLQQMYPTFATASAEDNIRNDELRINGVIIKRKP